MIAKIYIWDNGITMAFDSSGQQVPHINGDQLQGRLCQTRENILRYTTEETSFAVGHWNEWLDPVSRHWVSECPCLCEKCNG